MLEEINIYFLDDSELSEDEATMRGYRFDVYVVIENTMFHLNVFTNLRLQQEFEHEVKLRGYYPIEANIILAKGVSREEIIFCINQLHKHKFFEEIKPVENIKIDQLKKVQ